VTVTPTRAEPSVAPPISQSESVAPTTVPARPPAGDTELPLVPAFCSVCGDQPSEPAALTEDFELRTSPQTFLALRCGMCGSVFLALAPSEAVLDRIFPAAALTPRAPGWDGRPAGAARVLELGPWVSAEQLRRLPQSGAPYDVARLALTLECTVDPLATLEAVRAALRPGGQAVVLLNNLGSPAFAWFGGRHWGGYDTPRQRRVLSRDGLMRLAEAAGFALADITPVASAGPWIRSLHRWCNDWGAPAWLARRFSPEASVAPRLFRLLDLALRPSGTSTFLVATLRRPELRSP
jgi:hypothetical protein